MKKLLHERLREWAINRSPLTAATSDYGIDMFSSLSMKSSDLFKAIADEIEKYYFPRPLFEDGEPVQFGDDTDELNGVEKFIFMRSCGGCCQMQDADGNMLTVFTGGFVKRPKPKVLDADGVEIKVGDVVWHVSEPGEVGEVETLIPASAHVCVLWSTGAELYTPGVDLTHREPDSLEKVQDTIDALANVYESDDRLCDDLHNISDRLTALMERGA